MTPQVNPKNETSEMILNQTKASLNNFLLNLKKGSTMNDNLVDNKKNKIIQNMSNISRNTNNKKDDQGSIIDSYLRLSKKYENNNNINNSVLNYNKINNINNINTYKEITKNMNHNNNINNIRLNKIIDNSKLYEKNNTEGNLKDNYNFMRFNNLNALNTLNNNNQNNFVQYNTVKRTKYNFGLNLNNVNNTNNHYNIKSEERKNNNDYNTQTVKNLTGKLKKLKIENIKNKNDIFSLTQIYNEMQKILLQEISRYAKESKGTNNANVVKIQNELNEWKIKYNLLLESNKQLINEKNEKEIKIK
jgi:hypothetical protein